MGLFSTKKVTKVGTVVKRVIEDNALPDSVKSGMFNALLGERGDDAGIPSYVIEELVRSLGMKCERLYAWAKNNYEYGMPSSVFRDMRPVRQAVLDHLVAQLGGTIEIDYCHLASANDLHTGWVKLVQDHGYDPLTNQLGALSTLHGTPVYLEDMVVVLAAPNIGLRSPSDLIQWGVPPTAGYTPLRPAAAALASMRVFSDPEADPLAADDYVRVTAIRSTPTTEEPSAVTRETFTIPTPLSEEDEGDYLQVRYTRNGAPAYWTYRIGTGTWPTLDALASASYATAGEFFPFCYFRYDKQSMLSNTALPGYQDSVKFAKYLGIDFDQVATAIDENPDIADVEQAMLVFGVPPDSTDPIETRYLFDFFSALHGRSDTPTQGSPQAQALKRLLTGEDPLSGALLIQDNRFKMALSHDGIYRRMVTGSIGPIGSHTTAYSVEMLSHQFEYPNESGGVDFYTYDYPLKRHYFRRQVTTTVYEEILVTNLRLQYYVWGKYNTLADELDDILLIPVDHSISEEYSSIDRERLYARSMHMVFNSRVVTKVKWYQQGWFGDLLKVIAIVITIMSFGSDGGQLIAAVLALNSAAIIHFGLILLQRIFLQAVSAHVIKLFVKAVGLENAMFLAVLAAAYGGFQGLSKGAFAVPDARLLLDFSARLLQGVSASTMDLLGDLRSESEDFGLWMEQQTKLLEEAQELLHQNPHLNPYVVFGETPEDFYNRTIHAGNIGTHGFGAISSYVDTALKLPTLNETIGEERYE